MADQGISAAFPAPPAHFAFFTDDNVRRFKDKADGDAIEGHAEDEQVSRFMRPPAPPTKDYAVFGQRVPVWYSILFVL